MPVRRADSLTTLRSQCRAPNSLADSRHQACLGSAIRTRTPIVAKPVYHLPTGRLARISVSAAALLATEHLWPNEEAHASFVPMAKRITLESRGPSMRARFFLTRAYRPAALIIVVSSTAKPLTLRSLASTLVFATTKSPLRLT